MDLDAARSFMGDNHRAVMATTRGDGRPQMSAIAVGVDAEGRAVVSSTEGTVKVRNLRRDPRVSVFVMNPEFFGPWIQVDGIATVVPLPEALEPLVDYYRRVAGEHPNWDEYRQAMVDQQRVIIRIDIERAGPG
jgi:PPOX class probable F420-dependent enzyme